MMDKRYVLCVVIFVSFLACGIQKNTAVEETRQPAVNGKFYPADMRKLSGMVDRYLDVKEEEIGDKEIMGIIVPHAGYVYSGQTAGYGFKAVKGKEYSTVIILGSSHYSYLDKPCISDHKYWQTPLGSLKVDNKLLDAIAKKTSVDEDNKVFAPEHSLEVELPFLQRSLSGEFMIAPILINEFKIERLRSYARGLAGILKNKDRILIVMSTDMSHYYKSDKAEDMDKKVTEAIMDYDLKALENLMITKKGQLCGAGGVMLGLLTLRELGAEGIEALHYSHSGMTTGDNSQVVGYGAYAIYKKREEKIEGMGLNKEQKNELLKLARKTIEAYIKDGSKLEVSIDDPELNEECGIFVTLHKEGQLRGCIGNIFPVNKLYLAVRDMAIQSSTQDPRFPAVKENEIDELEIEISVLTVPREVDGADEVVLGRDGVIVKRGLRQGVYLPQVADETGWSKEEFLSSLCYSKAGLSADAWKEKDTTILTFQAQVFSEKEMGLK